MNIQLSKCKTRGASLLECLVYLGLLFVVIELAFTAYYRTRDSSDRFQKNADSMVSVLHVGEQWRAELRSAVADPEVMGDELRIQTAGGWVSYAFRENAIYRRHREGGTWARVLTSVEKSSFHVDNSAIKSWRWELQLKSREALRVKPLFTFQATRRQS